jgi:peptide/nickel transport system permease protein
VYLLLSRLVQGFLTVLILLMVVFVVARASGDPVRLMVPPDAGPEMVELVRHNLGLDRPLAVQFAIYVRDAATLNFGRSLTTRQPVTETLSKRFDASLKLAVVAMLLVLVMGVPLGIVAALTRGRWPDYVIRLLAALGQAAPPFVVGVLLVEVFALRWKVFPAADMSDWSSYVLPSVTLAAFVTAGIIRLLRSSMLEVLDTEYVRLARVKGVAESMVVLIHALRNALLPVVTYAALYFSMMLGGVIVVETVFNWPGVGLFVYESIRMRDFPAIQAVVVLVAVIVVLLNALVDLAYLALDPRIRYA